LFHEIFQGQILARRISFVRAHEFPVKKILIIAGSAIVGATFTVACNFCKVHQTFGCVPAVGMKLTNETWTIEWLVAILKRD
jgi:hypothetical protein